jgi:peptidoglycan hydrolase-like protein with peptidoglycan-binding domain
MSDLDIDRPYRKGDRCAKVRLIQEWISLSGFGVVTDGRFGPATQAAVRSFQAQEKLAVDGVVDDPTFAALIKPMRAALAPLQPRRSRAARCFSIVSRRAIGLMSAS